MTIPWREVIGPLPIQLDAGHALFVRDVARSNRELAAFAGINIALGPKRRFHHASQWRLCMILKTYTRIFTNDAEKTLSVLQKLHAGEPHLRFRFDPWELIGIGDVLVVAGSDEALAPIRGSLGPWIVTDLDETRQLLVEAGAEITREIALVPTGRMMYARHPDGSIVEYVEWTPDLVERLIDAPRRAGKLASQL